eukprot:m.220094 g.220094  ORF g.220094 m.220094 type:complete len:305 (+) comp10309_c0_seq1:257-1171(+)
MPSSLCSLALLATLLAHARAAAMPAAMCESVLVDDFDTERVSMHMNALSSGSPYFDGASITDSRTMAVFEAIDNHLRVQPRDANSFWQENLPSPCTSESGPTTARVGLASSAWTHLIFSLEVSTAVGMDIVVEAPPPEAPCSDSRVRSAVRANFPAGFSKLVRIPMKLAFPGIELSMITSIRFEKISDDNADLTFGPLYLTCDRLSSSKYYDMTGSKLVTIAPTLAEPTTTVTVEVPRTTTLGTDGTSAPARRAAASADDEIDQSDADTAPLAAELAPTTHVRKATPRKASTHKASPHKATPRS